MKAEYQRRKDDPRYLAQRAESHRKQAERRRAEGRAELWAAELERRRAEKAAAAAERAAERKRQRAKPWNARGLSSAEKWSIRYRLDPDFAIKERLRAAMRRTRNGYKISDLLRDALKRGGETGIADFLGYTVADLRLHLERQFKGRMSWQSFNAGRIHIDHIRPLSKFDLSDPDELRAAWSLSNLRPLYRRANLEKGAKQIFLV